MRRRVVSGGFEVDVGAQEAIQLFTPEGERNWVPGWNPTYPAGDPSETPGTVFVTEHGGVKTVWLIQELDADEGTAAYARVTPGHHAGNVRVSCEDAQAAGCDVSVTYDMSLLPGGDRTGLDLYEDHHFEAMMSEWSRAIDHHLHAGQESR